MVSGRQLDCDSGARRTGSGLFKIPVDGGPLLRLASDLALDPVWSPDGSLIVYADALAKGTASLLAVRPDGQRVDHCEKGSCGSSNGSSWPRSGAKPLCASSPATTVGRRFELASHCVRGAATGSETYRLAPAHNSASDLQNGVETV